MATPTTSNNPTYHRPDPRGHLTMAAYTLSHPSLPPFNLTSSLLPMPKPSSSEVLIKISHASLSPGAVIMAALFPAFLHTYPSIPELDFAGKVVSFAPGEQREFIIGDLVFGSIPVPQHLRGTGALSEYVAISRDCIAKIPEPKSFARDSTTKGLVEASSVPVSGCTALALMKSAGLEEGLASSREGMNVLVNGASGGVGSLVVQMVKSAVGQRGRVTAVCSERNRVFVTELGADEVVPYDSGVSVCEQLKGLCNTRARQFAEAAGKVLSDGEGHIRQFTAYEVDAGNFDLVVDAVGKQEIWHACESFLKAEGAYVTVGPGLEAWTRMALLKTLKQMAGNVLTPRWMGGVGRRYVQVASTVDKKGLLELKRMVEEGVIRGVVEKVYKWDEIGKAYEVMLSRRARGKIVVKVEQ